LEWTNSLILQELDSYSNSGSRLQRGKPSGETSILPTPTPVAGISRLVGGMGGSPLALPWPQLALKRPSLPSLRELQSLRIRIGAPGRWQLLPAIRPCTSSSWGDVAVHTLAAELFHELRNGVERENVSVHVRLVVAQKTTRYTYGIKNKVPCMTSGR